jgi:hypothetical protein
VQFFDGGSSLATVPLASGANGIVTFTTSALSSGTHTISASYSGDANFNPSTSQPLNLVVTPPLNQPTATSLSVGPNPANVGQSVTMTATVIPLAGTGPVTGTVTFSDNGGAIASVPLTNGTAVFTTSSLAAGVHIIVAVYGGSPNFSSSTSGSVTLVVSSPVTQISLSVVPNPTTFGQTVSLSATVTPSNGGGTPTGTITFSDGATTLATVTMTAGGASFSTATLTVGAHTLVASYSGDITFNPSTSLPVSLQVNKAPTTTSLSASAATVTPGQSVQLTAKVTPSPATAAGPLTGTVTFFDGGTAVAGPVPLASGGSASAASPALTAGSHSFTAAYSGDANFLASGSSAVPVSATGLTATTTTLSASPSTTAVGQGVSLSATVAPAGATGSVTFLDGSTTLGSQALSGGSASLNTSGLLAGTHSISAVYSGDSQFASSTSNTVTVTVTGKNNSTTSLAVSPSPVQAGQPVTLTATVTPSTSALASARFGNAARLAHGPSLASPATTPAAATGPVTFLDGGATLGSATLSNGVATLTTSALSAGSHTLTATYAGDGSTNSSSSAGVTEVVNGASVGSISPTALPTAIIGVPYSQTFTVTGGTPPLTWSLASGSVPGLTLSSGGVLSGTPTAAGTTTLTVRVQDGASPSTATAAVLSLTVLPLPALSLSAPTVSATTDQPAPQVTVSPAHPAALTATFTLSFTPNASNLPANFVNTGVNFITGGTTTGNISLPANSTTPVTLPAIQLGTVAGTITVTLTTLTLNGGQSVLPASPVTTTITVPRLAPVIVPGSVKIINITSTGFSVFLDGSATTRDLTSASLTFTAASGTQLNGATETVSLTTASTTWFTSTAGLTNGGAFSLTIPFAYSGDPTAIGTVSVTLTDSAGTSTAVSGGR